MHRAVRLTAIAIAASIVTLALPATSYADDTAAGDSTVILTFESNQADPSAAARAAVTAAGATGIGRVHTITAKTVAVTLNDTSASEASAVNDRLEAQPAVRASDTSVRFHATSTDDDFYNDQWDLNNATGSTYGVDAEDAWPTSTGSGAVVAVLDTGITVHSDLTGASSIVGGNTIAGYDFISDPRYSNDGNGYDSDPTDVVPNDNYHGTHVAGTVAALTNNHKGVAGVAPGAKVEPVRVLGVDGGSEEDIVAAIRWAAGINVPGAASNPAKADVINLSLGGPATCSYAMQSAINDAVAAGTAVVVAVGNGDADGNPLPLSGFMPANCANVIRVTASTKAGVLAPYSNYGSSSTPATISAPGGSGDEAQTDWIVSTWHDPGTRTEGYAGMAGTSMAAPHVSGILALMVAANPAITNAHRLDLLASAAKAFSGACPTSACGAGIAQAPAAVAAAAAAPVELTIDDPVVTGTAQVGATLTAGVSASRSGTRTSWQWLRSGAPISGATGSSYVPTAADIGATLAVRSKTGYLGASATRSSAATGVVAPGTFRQGRVPSISGKYKVRHKLTASVGVWSPTSTRTTYQWLRNGKKISRATSSHYKLAKNDKRKKISVKVTVSRPGYTSQTSTSASHKVK